MHKHKKDKPLGIFTMAMLSLAVVISLRNLPLTATLGLSSLFYYGLAVLGFMIPYALIAAELASLHSQGIYIWAKEAFGEKWGFFGIWMQWFHNMTWYPAMLAFIGASAAYLINPELAHNKIYLTGVILGGFWTLTIFNFLGISTSAKFSTICVIAGTIVPGIILVSLATYWISGGQAMAISLNFSEIIPKFKDLSSFTLLAGMFLALSGLEANANLAADMESPKKNYPRAILIGALCTLGILVLGSLAIAIVIPQSEISLVSGLIDAFFLFFKKYNLQWMTPIIIILTIAGSLGEMNAWMFAGTKGLYITSKSGCLPKLFQKVNKKDVPVNLMLFQAIMVTVSTVAFICLSSADLAYWILSALSVQMYLVMYVFLFLAGVVLRFKQPDAKRVYKIPGKNFGIITCAAVGLLCCLLALTVSFLPPPQSILKTHELLRYEFSLIVGFLFCILLPLGIYAFQKQNNKI